jgi:hypothetical protein
VSDMELPVEVDWLLMQCVVSCGKWRVRRGKCDCSIKHEQQRAMDALGTEDREWVKHHLRLSEWRP